MLSKFSVKKPFTVVVAIVIVLILGVISYLNVGVDLLPGMNLPYVAVVTVYPGATPETVETELTDPIEAALSEVGNVKQITSVSAEHYSLVLVEFTSTANVDKAYSDVDAKMRSVKLPDNDFVQDPVLLKINPSMLPVMTLSIGVDGKSIKESGGTLEKAIDKIKGVDGVSTVDTSGLVSDLVYVNMRTDRLTEYVLDYLNENFGVKITLSDGIKEQIYEAFRSADVANMSVIDAFDVVIDTLDAIGGDSLIVDWMIDYLRNERWNTHGVAYALFSQLLTNQFVFRDDADPALFGAFIDEVIAQSVSAVFRSSVESVFSRLSADLLNQLIFAQDFQMPAGAVTEGTIQTLVKVGSQLTTREEFSHLPIISFDVGASYSGYFDLIDASLDLLGRTTSEGDVSFTRDQLLTAIAALRLTASTQETLKELFDQYTDEEIASYVLSLIPIIDSVAEGVIEIPEDPDGDYVLNVQALQKAISDAREMLVVPLTLDSIADVTYFDNSTESLTFMLTRAQKGEDLTPSGGVIVSINKEPDKSTVEVTNGVISALNGLKGEEFDGFRYTVLSNDGETVNFMLKTVLMNLLWGGLLAIGILLLFLRSIKPTLVVGSSIVISVVFTFVMMYFAGITLNVVSMGGLALGVGMLVDNSIVVIENIARLKSQGKDVFTAAVQGAKQVGGAILASTLTTVVVFLPIAFISGLTKEIFSDMALTICFSLLASLLVALTLVPMAASTFMKKPGRKETKVFRAVRRGYAKALKFVLKYKFIPLVLVLVLFGGAVFAVFKMDITLFPQTDASTFTATVEIDREGLARYNETNEEGVYLTYDDAITVAMDTLTDILNGKILVPDPICEEYALVPYDERYDASWTSAISSAGLYVSKGMSVGGYAIGGGDVRLSALLTDEKSRSVGSTFLCELMEKFFELEDVNKGFMTIETTSGGVMNSLGSGSNAYVIRLYGEDADLLRSDAVAFAETFKKPDGTYTVGGVTRIETGQEVAEKEYRVVIDRTKAGVYGLTVAQVYQQVAAALSAVSASETVNLYTDEIRTERSVYVYDARYKTEAWYECVDPEGGIKNVFVKNNVSDFERAEYAVKNFFGKGVYYKRGDGYAYAPNDGEIKVDVKDNGFGFAYVTEEDDRIVEKEYLLTKSGPEIHYSASRIEAFDLMTMAIVSADPLGTGAESETVPLYKLVSDECLQKGEDGKVLYRDGALGEKIPLAFEQYDSYSRINHRDKKKTIEITFTYDSTRSSREIESDLKRAMNDHAFSEGIKTEFSDGNPYMEEVFRSLLFVLVLAVVFIYLVMVAQFQSLKSPFVIMLTIPLAFTGGVAAMLIAGLPISVMSLMGLIVLVGVVVNNGIVFVDYCNKLIRSGVDKKTAIIRAGMDRLRPILMTALTTIVALIVMAADGSEGAAMLKPLAVTAIGGMIFSTLLTLFLVPVTYDLFNRKIKRTKRDEALSKVVFSTDDDGLTDWDEENAAFVKSLLTPAHPPEEVLSTPAEGGDLSDQVESVKEEKSEDKVAPEEKENAVLREIKRRRKDLFPEEE